MKRYLVVFCCLCVLVLAGCSKGPSDTVNACSKALEQKSFDKAFGYFSEEDVEKSRLELKVMLEQSKGFLSMLPAEDAAKVVKMEESVNGGTKEFFEGMMQFADDEGKPFAIEEILREEIDGDKATVWYKNQGGEEESFGLVKEDGTWVMLFSSPKS